MASYKTYTYVPETFCLHHQIKRRDKAPLNRIYTYIPDYTVSYFRRRYPGGHIRENFASHLCCSNCYQTLLYPPAHWIVTKCFVYGVPWSHLKWHTNKRNKYNALTSRVVWKLSLFITRKIPNELISVRSNCVKLHTNMGLDRTATYSENPEPSLVLIQLSLINIKVLFIHQLRH